MDPASQRESSHRESSNTTAFDHSYPEAVSTAHSYPEVAKAAGEGYRDINVHHSGYEVKPATASPVVNHEKPTSRDGHRVPCGLSAVAFTLLVALLSAVIIGAAVGGGLGSSLAHEKNQNQALEAAASSLAGVHTTTSGASPTASTTVASPTATNVNNYVVLPPSDIASLALNCPAIDSQSYATIRAQSYTKHCGVSLNGYDIASIIAYTFDDCIEACSSLNYFTGNATLCTAALFSTNIAHGASLQHANCWLKDTVYVNAQGVASVAVAYLDNGGGTRRFG